MSWKLKGCPKCGGDIIVDEEYEQGVRVTTEYCIQCGYRPVEPLFIKKREYDLEGLEPLPDMPDTTGIYHSSLGKIKRAYMEENNELILRYYEVLGKEKTQNLLHVGNIIWYEFMEKYAKVATSRSRG